MKKIILTMPALLLIALSACEPNMNLRLSDINGSAATTGRFEKALDIAIPQSGGGDPVFIQDGVSIANGSSVDKSKPYCALAPFASKVLYDAGYVLKQKSIQLPMVQNKEQDAVNLKLIRATGQFEVDMSVTVYVPVMSNRPDHDPMQIDHFDTKYVVIRSLVECSPGGAQPSFEETDQMTLGELMDIFKFEYALDLPSA